MGVRQRERETGRQAGREGKGNGRADRKGGKLLTIG